MEFKYYVYLIAGGIIILLAIYALITHLFPSLSFKKEFIDIEFSEKVIISELVELGAFKYNKLDKELQNEITLPFWTSFKIASTEEVSNFELNFESNDRKNNLIQIEDYKSIVNYSIDFWQDVLNKILKYSKKYYSDLEIEELKVLNLEKLEDLKSSIQLIGILINQSGSIGM